MEAPSLAPSRRSRVPPLPGSAGARAGARASRSPRSGMARISPPWYPTTGPVRSQLACEPHRAGDHPPGHERDVNAPAQSIGDRRPGVGTDRQVVADERSVDVERDQPDGQDRRRRGSGGHPKMMPDERYPRRRAPPVNPGGSVPRAAARPGRSRPSTANRAATLAQRATIASPWSAPISSSATPSSMSASGSRASRRSMTARPSTAAVERDGRLERRRDRQPGQRIVADVRQVRENEVERVVRSPPVGSRSTRAKAIASATACPTAFSRARSSASPDRSVARISTASSARRRRRITARATAMAPLPVPTSTIRIGAAGDERATPPSRRLTSASASSTRRSVSGRGMSARRSTLKASP